MPVFVIFYDFASQCCEVACATLRKDFEALPKNTSAAGTYGAILATACVKCPDNSQSPSRTARVTGCTCMFGFSGPRGGPCKKSAEIIMLEMKYTTTIPGAQNTLTMEFAVNDYLLANSTVELIGLINSPTESGRIRLLRSSTSESTNLLLTDLAWERTTGKLSFRLGQKLSPNEAVIVSWQLQNPLAPQSQPPGEMILQMCIHNLM